MGNPGFTMNGFRDAEEEWGDLDLWVSPPLAQLVQRLRDSRAAYARGYLKYFVERRTLSVRSADLVLEELGRPHWFVKHYPRGWLDGRSRYV
jgi:hypothetical protein